MNLSKRGRVILSLACGLITFGGAFFIFGNPNQSTDLSIKEATSNPAAVNPDIFVPVVPKKATYTSEILFMGDSMLARGVGQKIKQGSDPFINVSGVLADHDARIINIETTIADPSKAVQASGKLYTFNAPLESLKSLKKANIDLSVLANNHTSDYGPTATTDMLDQFNNAKLATVGAGKTVEQAFAPTIVEVQAKSAGQPNKTVRLAVIGVNDIENTYTKVSTSRAGSAYFDKKLIAKSVKQAKSSDKADIVIVFPHWGVEYTSIPSARQREWGKFFIDSGADVVIGGHPHVVQPTEEYKGKYIVYSMGNFIFDGMSGDALKGQMISLKVTKTYPAGNIEVSKPSNIPTVIDSNGFPSKL